MICASQIYFHRPTGLPTGRVLPYIFVIFQKKVDLEKMEEYAIDFAKEYNAEYWSVSSLTGLMAYSTLNNITMTQYDLGKRERNFQNYITSRNLVKYLCCMG